MRLIDKDELLHELKRRSDVAAEARMTLIAEDFIDLVNDADVAEVPRWIPVTERLPEEAGEYLVAFHYNYGGTPLRDEVHVGLDSFRGKTQWAKQHNRTVTHWMKKPDPPEVE